MKRKFLILMAVLAVACWAPMAGATIITNGGAPYTLSGDSLTTEGHFISGSASFYISGGDLFVSLTNTTPAVGGQLFNDQVLQGVFWNDLSGVTLTPLAALASSVFHDPIAAQNGANMQVGGEYGYKTGALNPAVGSTDRMIYGAGTYGGGNPNGVNSFFFPPGTNLNGPVNPDGGQYGIVSASTTVAPTDDPYVRNNILFSFDLPVGVTSYSFDQVGIFFGTSPGNVVPVPPTVWLMGSGLIGIGLLGWRRRKS